jgi:hypothetical protein
MKALKSLSQILVLIPIAMLLFDLVHGWFVLATLKVDSFSKWLKWASPEFVPKVKPLLLHVMSAKNAEAVMNAPGPVIMFVPPLVIYILYRVIFAIKGGTGGGNFKYNSRY